MPIGVYIGIGQQFRCYLLHLRTTVLTLTEMMKQLILNTWLSIKYKKAAFPLLFFYQNEVTPVYYLQTVTNNAEKTLHSTTWLSPILKKKAANYYLTVTNNKVKAAFYYLTVTEIPTSSIWLLPHMKKTVYVLPDFHQRKDYTIYDYIWLPDCHQSEGKAACYYQTVTNNKEKSAYYWLTDTSDKEKGAHYYLTVNKIKEETLVYYYLTVTNDIKRGILLPDCYQ